jgi:hypothetical protein
MDEERVRERVADSLRMSESAAGRALRAEFMDLSTLMAFAIDADGRVRVIRRIFDLLGRTVFDWRSMRTFSETTHAKALEFRFEVPPGGPDLTVDLYRRLGEPDPLCRCRVDGRRCLEVTQGVCAAHRRTIDRRLDVLRAAAVALQASLPRDLVHAVLDGLRGRALLGADCLGADWQQLLDL